MKETNRISPISYENGYEDGYAKGVKDLAGMVANLPPADLRTLRAIINGKLSKRTISPEAQAKMQAGRRKGDLL